MLRKYKVILGSNVLEAGKKGGGSNQGTGRGHGPGRGGKKKDTYNTPKPSPKTDAV